MKITVAQIKPITGDIATNIALHQKYIHLAVAQRSEFIVFPELSLTGYEPNLADTLATDANNRRFEVFQHLSDQQKISIGVGVPTKHSEGISISMLLFQPQQARQTYFKKYLHADEEPFFTSMGHAPVLKVGDKNIALAICYELFVPAHAQEAFQNHAQVYLCSVAKPEKGVTKAMERLSNIAQTHQVPVLMANSVGHCDNFESAGKSSIWNTDGVMVGQLDDTNEGILTFDTETQKLIE